MQRRAPAARLILLFLVAVLLALPALAWAGGIDAELQSRLAEAVRARAGVAPGAQVIVKGVKASNAAALKKARSVVSVELPPGEKGLGKVTASVTVSDKSGHEEDLWVTARVEVALPVVVAARDVARGVTVAPADVKLETRSGLRGEAFVDVAEVIGRQTRRPLRKGDVLDPRSVTLPIAIERGDIVDAVVSGAAFVVRSRAEARESGAVGDVIRVQLLGGAKKIVRGRVVSAQLVEVVE